MPHMLRKEGWGRNVWLGNGNVFPSYEKEKPKHGGFKWAC